MRFATNFFIWEMKVETSSFLHYADGLPLDSITWKAQENVLSNLPTNVERLLRFIALI
jgi:hypothetical protein